MASQVELERLLVRLVGDGSQYVAMLDQSGKKTQQFGGTVDDMAAKVAAARGQIEGFGGGLVSQLTALAGVTGAFGAAWKGVGLAADAEETRVSFGVMLESMERGVDLTQDLQKFAAATPLNSAEIQQATKTLLQFGTSATDIIPTLKRLGDVTGGNAQRFAHMALAFGQMQASGRLMGGDLFQMINAGFNPLKEIARTTGKDMATLKDEMEKGAITVDMVKEAFRTATEPGGQFAGLMEKQSKTLHGLFSTMQDDSMAFFRTIGEGIAEGSKLKEMMQLVSKGFQLVTEAVQNNGEEFNFWLKIVGAVSLALGAGGGLLGTFTAATMGAVALTSAVKALGAAAIAVTANPIVLAAVALGAAGAYGAHKMYQGLSGDTPGRAAEREALREAAAAKGEAAAAGPGSRLIQSVMDQEEGPLRRAAAQDALAKVENEIKQTEAEVVASRAEFNRTGDNRDLEHLVAMEAMLKEQTRQREALQQLAKDPTPNHQLDLMLKHMEEEISLLGKVGAQKQVQLALNAKMKADEVERVRDMAVNLENAKAAVNAAKMQRDIMLDAAQAEDDAFRTAGAHAKKVMTAMRDLPVEQRHHFEEALEAARKLDAADEARAHDPFQKYRDIIQKTEAFHASMPEKVGAFRRMQDEAAKSLVASVKGDVTDSFDPHRSAAEMIDELTGEYQAGRLPLLQYRHGLMGVAEGLEEVAKRAMMAESATQHFDAARADSAEGFARAYEQARENSRTDRQVGIADLKRLANPRFTPEENAKQRELLGEIRDSLKRVEKFKPPAPLALRGRG